MASIENLTDMVNIDSSDSSSDEVRIIDEIEGALTNHRCDLCCRGEFLVDKLLQFGGLINEKYKFVCDKCDKNFIYKAQLQKHITGCTGPVVNSSLTEVIPNNSSEQISNTITIKCKACPEVFKSRRGLTRHLNIKHSGFTQSCQICKKVFSSLAKFRQHHFKHEFQRARSFVCDICDKRFASKSSLQRHLLIHAA